MRQRQPVVFPDNNFQSVGKHKLAQDGIRLLTAGGNLLRIAAQRVQADFRHIRGGQPPGAHPVQVFRGHAFNGLLPFGGQVQVACAEPVSTHFRGHAGSRAFSAQTANSCLLADSLEVFRKIFPFQVPEFLEDEVPHPVPLGAVHIHSDGERPLVGLGLVGMHLNAVHQPQPVMEFLIKPRGTAAAQNTGQGGQRRSIRMRGTGQAPRQAQLGIRHSKLLPHRPGTELMGLVRERLPVQRLRLQILHQQLQVGQHFPGIHIPGD